MNRREMLTGIAGAGATVALSAPTIAKSLPADRAQWDAAFAYMEACKAKADESERAWEPIYEAYEAGIPTSDHINWKEFSPCPDKRHILHGTFDVDAHEQWRLGSEGKLWWAKDPDNVRAEIKATCEQVREFRRQLKALNDRLGYDAATDRLEKHVDQYSAALTALVELPAPDAEALLWKINHLFTAADTTWTEEYTAQFHSDATRLLSQGRA